MNRCDQNDHATIKSQPCLWFAARMIESAFRTNQFAFPALEQSATIDAVLPIVICVDFAPSIREIILLLFRANFFFHPLSFRAMNHHARSMRAIPAAFTAPTMLKGSRSVVRDGTSSDE